MKREEVLSIFPEAKPEQVQSIMNLYGEGVENVRGKLKETNQQLVAVQNELKKTQDEHEKEVQAKMSAEDKLTEQLQKAEALQRNFAIKSNELEVKELFADAGIQSEQFAPILKQIVSEDKEVSIAQAKAFADIIAHERETALETAKKDLLGSVTNPQGEGSNGVKSRKDFLNLTYSDQLKMLDENPNILTELN